jgi:putative aldouronate transport system permease protein
MGNPQFFRGLVIVSDIRKEFGFGAIIYLAAITGVNPTLYEASSLDGANGFQQLRHVTLPGISSTIILVMILSLGGILKAGFENMFSMYNTMVMSTSDIIDTWVYRMGLNKTDFPLSTAAGLIKSTIGMVVISMSYVFAYKYADYKLF